MKSIFIIGPTASGKTSLGTFLAQKFSGEIISADSRQIYKDFDVGTGKELEEYHKFGKVIPYYLIDEISWKEEFNVYHFQKKAFEYVKNIYKRKKLPFIVGGSSLYLSSLLNNYEFSQSPKNLADFFNDKLILSPYYLRSIIHQRIEKRLLMRWDDMIKEVKSLLDKGVPSKKLDSLGLEYRYINYFTENKMKEKEAFEKLLVKIRHFARRQDIWLRKLEKQGHTIHYLEQNNKEKQAETLVQTFIDGGKLPKVKISLTKTYYGPKSQ